MNSAPRMTLAIGGVLLSLVGLLGLLPIVLSWIPAAEWASSAFRSAPAQSLQLVALFAGCLVLAFGARGEHGIAASSVAGRAAFVVLALAFPIQGLVSFALASGGQLGTVSTVVIGTALAWVPVAAVLVAAVAVVRAGVLHGFARWALLAYGATEAIVFALASVPNASQQYYLVVLLGLVAVPPALLVAAGASFVLTGRSDAIGRRMRSVYSRWRLTTSVS